MPDRPTPSAAPNADAHLTPPLTAAGEPTDPPADTSANQQPRPPSPGRYELGDEIARGGMEVGYRATDTALGREVAVEVLQDRFTPGSRRSTTSARCPTAGRSWP